MAAEQSPTARGVDRGRLRRLVGHALALRHTYPDELDRQRAAAVSIMSLIFAGLGLAGVAVVGIGLPGALSGRLLPLNILLALAYLGPYALAQSGRLRLAKAAFVLLALLVPAAQSVPYGFLSPEVAALSYAVSIIGAAFLFGPGWSFAVAVAGMALVAAGAVAQSEGEIGAPGASLVGPLAAIFLLGMLAFLAWLLSGNLFTWARNAQRRALQLEAAVVISETAATAPRLRDLLVEVVERIRETHGFYHAQVFLLDEERRMARLEASTGRAGEAMLARGHALPVGSQSVVGQCAASGSPVIVNDTAGSAIHRPNELLPDTRAELALPLIVGRVVTGVLDVQSTQAGAFQPDDVRSLQVLAAQLAAAIDKARLVDALQARAAENERLFEEAQRSLREIEELNRRLTREGWSDYLRARRLGAMGFTLQGSEIAPDTTWTAPMRQAYTGESSVVIRHDQQAHIAAVPVRVHGEVIGVLEVERSAGQPWGDAELELVEALAERLALALENARLYEQATDAVEREQILNRIAQGVQEASSIDEVLRAALAELGEALGASRGMVQISPRAQQAAQPEPAAPGSQG